MSFNTILVPIEQHDLMSATLETALVLARKFNGYIEGFALRPVVAPVMAMDIGGAFPLAELQENDTKMATEAKALFDAFMHKHSVRARRPQGRRGAAAGSTARRTATSSSAATAGCSTSPCWAGPARARRARGFPPTRPACSRAAARSCWRRRTRRRRWARTC